nr:unnamed protein product [Callosobruchus chinensis]
MLILAEKLKKMHIPEKLSHHLTALYKNRNTYIRTCDELVGPRITSRGQPQGSILSPVLYIIYSDDFQSIFNADIKIFQFADDYAISTRSKAFAQSSQKLEKAILVASKWF